MNKKQTIRQKIKSMTAREIIMAMVDGLRNPVTEIDMDTFGEVRNGICYGCAATNTVCKIGGYTIKDLLKVEGESCEVVPSVFISNFEYAIDELRKGRVGYYNDYAENFGFAHIKSSADIVLPYLFDDYTESELSEYVKLAELQ